MKKTALAIVEGVIIFALSSCGQAKNLEHVQTDVESSTMEISADEVQNDLYEGEYADYDVNEPS